MIPWSKAPTKCKQSSTTYKKKAVCEDVRKLPSLSLDIEELPQFGMTWSRTWIFDDFRWGQPQRAQLIVCEHFDAGLLGCLSKICVKTIDVCFIRPLDIRSVKSQAVLNLK